MATIQVKIDERVRLVTAVLAASQWPDEEQQKLTHAVHPHAKQVRQFAQRYRHHQAVQGVNEALINGVTLEELFSTAVRCSWPTFEPTELLPNLLKIERWARSLSNFEHDSDITNQFWPQHTDHWQTAVDALNRIFQHSPVLDVFQQITRTPISADIIIMPNIVYPALTPVFASNQNQLYLLLPPPKAVGESPPWPYDEDAAYVVATVCQELSVRLLATQLAQFEQPQWELFRHAATAHCLQAHFDEFEAQAYLLRTKKEQKLPTLPAITEQLGRYMAGDLAEFADLFA